MTDLRRLAVVECRTITGDPDGTHLSVEGWNARLGEWLTSLALCGRSAEQGALPAGTAVTCADCEGYRDTYERALAGQPTAEEERVARLQAQLNLATEFRIPCPEPADPGRPDGAPVMHPEALIVRKSSPGYLGDTDGWTILNPNLPCGDHVWTGTEWKYRGELHREVIYRWTRDQALAEAQRLAVDETARYEAWLVTMRAGRRTT